MPAWQEKLVSESTLTRCPPAADRHLAQVVVLQCGGCWRHTLGIVVDGLCQLQLLLQQLPRFEGQEGPHLLKQGVHLQTCNNNRNE